MANNNNNDLCRRMEAQEQASRAQQEALNNIQHMLSQLMTDRNKEKNFDNNEREENRTPENKNTKEYFPSSIDPEVIKDIQA